MRSRRFCPVAGNVRIFFCSYLGFRNQTNAWIGSFAQTTNQIVQSFANQMSAIAIN